MKKINIKKWILGLFAVLWVGSLLVPNRALFREKENAAIVRKENRIITAVPDFKPKTKQFYVQIEKAYQDRLYKREKSIYFWKTLLFDMGVSTKRHIVFGKKGWLFDKGAAVNSLPDIDVKMKRLKEIQDFCENKGSKFVFIATPYKNSIYPEYVPDRLSRRYKDRGVTETEIIEKCKQYGVYYVDLYHPLMEGKRKFEQPLYWWDDHHWSYPGMAIAADTMLKYFRSQGLNVKYEEMPFDGTYHKAPKSNSHVHALGVQKIYVTEDNALWSKKFTEEIFLQFTDKTGKMGKEECFKGKKKYPYPNIEEHRGEKLVINKVTPNHVNVMILGNSMSGYMSMYLSQFVDKIVGTHYAECKGIKKNVDMQYLLERYKPDIVVLQVSEPSLNGRKDYCFSKIKL